MNAGKCDHCGKEKDHLIYLTDHPDYYDGCYCEECIDSLHEKGEMP